jgi:DNA-binding transcriptional ArsR family regulator
MLNAMVKRSISLDSIFAALADPTRRRILEGLMDGCAHVGQLSRPFTVSAPAISRHLRVLERAGLVRRTRRGRIHEMELAAEPLRRASDWLDTYRRHWEASLDALARYLESGEPKKPFRTKTKPKRTKPK